MTETYRIRSPETWAQAREDYLAGLSAEAVCSRHDLGLSAFRRRARREGWRRADQDDPAAVDADLSIYADVEADEQAELARLRFIEALHHGRAAEAARWRWLWRDLQQEGDAFDADSFPGKTRREIGALMAEERDELDLAEEALGLARPGKVHDVHPAASGALSAGASKPLPGLPRAGKVHHVHSNVSRALFAAAGAPPPRRPPPAPFPQPAAVGATLRNSTRAAP